MDQLLQLRCNAVRAANKAFNHEEYNQSSQQ
jgi:hypothetical protein